MTGEREIRAAIRTLAEIASGSLCRERRSFDPELVNRLVDQDQFCALAGAGAFEVEA